MKPALSPLRFFLVALLVFGCGKAPAPEVLKRAQENEELSRRILDTMRVKPDPRVYFADIIKDYTSLVEDYEDTPESEVALFRRAAIRNNDTREHDLAVEDYQLYARRYPDGEKTPLVMFLVGYIYNNELGNLDSAAAAYTRFLAKYPDSEMAPSAQFELNSLGKSPEELLPKESPPDAPPKKRVAKKGT